MRHRYFHHSSKASHRETGWSQNENRATPSSNERDRAMSRRDRARLSGPPDRKNSIRRATKEGRERTDKEICRSSSARSDSMALDPARCRSMPLDVARSRPIPFDRARCRSILPPPATGLRRDSLLYRRGDSSGRVIRRVLR